MPARFMLVADASTVAVGVAYTRSVMVCWCSTGKVAVFRDHESFEAEHGHRTQWVDSPPRDLR